MLLRLACVLVLSLSSTLAQALELDLGAQRPSDLLAAVNTLLPRPVLVDPHLLAQVATSPKQALVLRNGDEQTLAQALACQFDCWWAQLPDGRIVLSRDQQVLSQAWINLPHKQRVATTALIQQDLIAEEIRELLILGWPLPMVLLTICPL